MTLTIKDRSSIILEGYLDSTGALQFRHGDDELAHHGDSVEVYSEGPVQFLLRPPGGRRVTAQHEGDDGIVQWSTSEDGAQHIMPSAMTDPAEVHAAAQGSAQGSSTPKKIIHIKVTPTGGLPDA